MAAFVVSYCLQDEDSPDYYDRYKSLTDAIEAEASDDYWNETTSFYILTSDKTATELKDSIIGKATINADDVVVVINLSAKPGYTQHGVANKTLFKKLLNQR